MQLYFTSKDSGNEEFGVLPRNKNDSQVVIITIKKIITKQYYHLRIFQAGRL